jgi:hypothetical protein
LALTAAFFLAAAGAAFAASGEFVRFPGVELQGVGNQPENVLAPSGSHTGKSNSLSGNVVTHGEGYVEYNIYGAVNLNDRDPVYNNHVDLYGHGDQYVYGGYGIECDVTDNSVFIGSGSANWDVVGGRTKSGNATGNTVTLGYGGRVGDSIYGGVSETGDATGNTVILWGGTVSFSVFGGAANQNGDGETGEGDAFSGNTLVVEGFIGSVSKVKNFEYYKFFISIDVADGGVILDVNEAVDLNGTDVEITGWAEGYDIQAGFTATLISKVTGAPKTAAGMAFEEGRKYDTDGGSWSFSTSGGKLTATKH